MFSNIYKGRRVLVTGHTGFKGSWLVAWLQYLGANVLGIALKPDTKPSHFTILKSNIKSHICDIRDYKKTAYLIKSFSPEIVFHLAAQPLVRESYESPLYTFETNVIGTANILEGVKGIKPLRAVVVITTDKCYENCECSRGHKETDVLGGYDPYSASKAAAELVVSSYRNSFFNIKGYGEEHKVLIASARAGNVIGGGDWARDRLIPDIIRATVEGKSTILRNPQATRPWQHVLDSLSGYLCLGEKLFKGNKKFAEAWNFSPAPRGEITVLDIAKKMHKFWPRVNFRQQCKIRQPHEACYLRLDSSKARSVLKWRSVWEISQSLQMTIDWYREFYENQKVLTNDQLVKYINDAKQKKMYWVF